MKNILLIGTGPMAIEYAKVLNHLGLSVDVVGRGEESAVNFQKITGIKPHLGGLDQYLIENNLKPNTYAIVATGTESLMNSLLQLIENNVARVLIEKPAAISIEELLMNEKVLAPFSSNIFVAYNRRFYSSVLAAEEMISEDGGLKSILFEFTEWSHRIGELNKAEGVKQNWFFANPTHVIDLAFYFAGTPIKFCPFSEPGTLEWHNKSNFVGAGITNKGVLFSYCANWESAGRWGLELLTNKRRIYLKPMEELHCQNRGSLNIEKIIVDDKSDLDFKPGLLLQTEAFVNGGRYKNRLLNIADHICIAKSIYKPMIS